MNVLKILKDSLCNKMAH